MKPLFTFALAILLTARAVAQVSAPKFDLTIMGEIEDKPATEAGFKTDFFKSAHLSFHIYEAPSGEKFMVQLGNFSTDKKAVRYYQFKQQQAAKVLSGDQQKDGRIRSELVFDEARHSYGILWHRNAVVGLIFAPDIERARALEIYLFGDAP